jgi:hypothetical protein
MYFMGNLAWQNTVAGAVLGATGALGAGHCQDC